MIYLFCWLGCFISKCLSGSDVWYINCIELIWSCNFSELTKTSLLLTHSAHGILGISIASSFHFIWDEISSMHCHTRRLILHSNKAFLSLFIAEFSSFLVTIFSIWYLSFTNSICVQISVWNFPWEAKTVFLPMIFYQAWELVSSSSKIKGELFPRGDFMSGFLSMKGISLSIVSILIIVFRSFW